MNLIKLSFAAIIFLLAACSVSKYSATNKSYKQQAKAYAKELMRKPDDSSHTAAFWAGTTNFSMRKPNFVNIHQTAQNS